MYCRYTAQDLFIDRFFIYPSVGSDHFPIGCTFHINTSSDEQEDLAAQLESGEMAEVNDLIEEGKQEESDNRTDIG